MQIDPKGIENTLVNVVLNCFLNTHTNLKFKIYLKFIFNTNIFNTNIYIKKTSFHSSLLGN